MENLTQEEFNKLDALSKHLISAGCSSYVTGLDSTSFNELCIIYRRIFRDNGTLTISCNSCVLKVLKSLYQVYLQFKKKQENGKEESRN